MTGVLAGRSAIVTGAGQGIGRGIALALAGEDAAVAVLGRTESKLVDTCGEIERRGGRALPVVCDVRKLNEIEAAVVSVVASLGGVSILVNNAQMVPYGLMLDVTEEAVDDAWRSGPLAALRFMRTCHPHLRGGGAIVNIGAGAGLGSGPPNLAAYGAVKAALAMFTRSAAVQWGPDGIRANLLLPFAASPAVAAWMESDPEGYEASMTRVPMRRIADPETDVGRAVVFLVGPDAGLITGTTLTVDGGLDFLR
jgi:meso-butanediol dehydrogenase / (S,S)-butanediol dehydrogenase / diacetyl reductase